MMGLFSGNSERRDWKGKDQDEVMGSKSSFKIHSEDLAIC